MKDPGVVFWPFLPVTDLHFEVCIVPQELGHPAAKGKDDKEKEKHPLDDVDDHLAEGDLEWPQVGVDGEQVGHLLKSTSYKQNLPVLLP